MIKLKPNQSRAVSECLQILEDSPCCILIGEVGSGKTCTTFAVAQGKRIAYLTETRLPTPKLEDYELSPTEIVRLNYSELKHSKASDKSVIESAKKIADKLKGVELIIVDEMHNLRNLTSQRTKVFCALICELGIPILMCSGTPRSKSNENLIVLLELCKGTHLLAGGYPTLKKMLLESLEHYAPKFPMPHINRFAFVRKDFDSDRLNKILLPHIVRMENIKLHDTYDIALYEYLIVCDSKDDKIKKFLSRIKKDNILLDKGYIPSHRQNRERVWDGHYEVRDDAGNTLEYRYQDHSPKLVETRNIVRSHDKSIVLTSYRHSATYVAERLPIKTFLYEADDSNRSKVMQEFEAYSGQAVLVSTVSALSTGFNLGYCDAIVYYSVPNNYIDLIQSLGRINRMDISSSKYYYWLTTDNSEEKKSLKKKYLTIRKAMREYGFLPVMATEALFE